MRSLTALAVTTTLAALLATAPIIAVPGYRHVMGTESGLDQCIMKPFTATRLIGEAFAACIVHRTRKADRSEDEKVSHGRIAACIRGLYRRIYAYTTTPHRAAKRKLVSVYDDEDDEDREEVLEDYSAAIRLLYHPRIADVFQDVDVGIILNAGLPLFHQVMSELTFIKDDHHLKTHAVKAARGITHFLGTLFIASKEAIADASDRLSVGTKERLHTEIIAKMELDIYRLHLRMTNAVNLSFDPYSPTDRSAPLDLSRGEAVRNYIAVRVPNHLLI